MSNGVGLQRSMNMSCWLRMVTSSNGNMFRVTGLLWGETTGHRWIPLMWGETTGHRWIPLTKARTRSFDVFFDLCLIKRLSKQSRCRWFETPSRSLWHHCNCSHILGIQKTLRSGISTSLYNSAWVACMIWTRYKNYLESRFCSKNLDSSR